MNMDCTNKLCLSTEYITTLNDVDKILEQLRKKKIIVYGAGRTALKLKRELEKQNIEILCFWDNGNKLLDKLEGIPIFNPNYTLFSRKKEDYIIICNAATEKVVNSMIKSLKDNCLFYPEIINGRELISLISQKECLNMIKERNFSKDVRDCNSCSGNFENCVAYRILIKKHLGHLEKDEKKEQLHIETLTIEVTNRCTLKCKDCLQKLHMYKKREDFSAELIISDLIKLTNVVDFVYKIYLIGGEFFLYEEAEKFLKQLLKIKKIGVIVIPTNGTVLPSDDLLQLISSNRVVVNISDYGKNITDKTRNTIREIIKKFNLFNIKYSLNQTITWFDYGNFDYKDKNEKDLIEVFSACDTSCKPLLDGRIYHCDRNAHGVKLGLIPENNKDYCNVRYSSEKQLFRDLKGFLNTRCISACNYCGLSLNLEPIEAGVQLRSEEID